MRKLGYALLPSLLMAMTPTQASPAVTGEYLCDGGHGYLTVTQLRIRKAGPETCKVRLVVGCVTRIEIDGNKASVSDSCIKPEDEESSTCALMGEYSKRK
jgi:hypothetical protein